MRGGIFIVLFMDQIKYLKLINDSTESYYSSTQLCKHPWHDLEE